MALGDSPTLRVPKQGVVAVDGHGQAEELLEKAVQRCSRKQVLASSDVGHALRSVINHHGQVVAGRDVLARQHDVTEFRCQHRRIQRDPASLTGGTRADLLKGEVTDGRRTAQRGDGAGHVEPQCVGCLNGSVNWLRMAGPAGSGIDPAGGLAVGRGECLLDFPSRADAGVEETPGLKALQGLPVRRHSFGLAQYGRFPGKPEPGEILEYRGLVFRATSPAVDVLDSQQKPAVCLTGDLTGG